MRILPALRADRVGAIALGLLVVVTLLAPLLGAGAAASPASGSSFGDASSAALGGAQRVFQGDGLVRAAPPIDLLGAEAGSALAPPATISSTCASAPDEDVARVERSPVRRF